MSNTTPTGKEPFAVAGDALDHIDVKISHRIIQLFSEGLYSSPNKAIEELVSNSFDAGAQNVHVILSSDLRDPDATIVVIDDGEGMDSNGLKRHWIIGESTRRTPSGSARRKPIGRFGIGKLSTYVLARKLTHICKSGGTYYAATMDYSDLAGDATGVSKGVFDEQTVKIPLRVLAEAQALEVMRRWTTGDKEGYSALTLFGPDASESWTAAIMSDLKELGAKVSIGRLNWILRTAMPRRTDFRLFLDGDPVTTPETEPPLAKFVIGKDFVQLPEPSPQGLIAREDLGEPKNSIHRHGVYHDEALGRITGHIEIFESDLDRGKEKFEQSSGFFVYVRERRVNVDDPGFGIERNLLRHGTFSKFRMVVHVDSLDSVLRSSRESFQQGELYVAVQNFLRAGFNLARNRLVEYDRTQTPASRISARISSAPGSLTRKPLLALAHLVAENRATPFYMRFPTGLSAEDLAEFLKTLKADAEGEDGLLRSTELAVLDSNDGLALFDIQQRKLLINSSHPFVAAFQEFFTNAIKSLPLEMLAMAEVLMEAHLYHMGLDESMIRDSIARRDELLRQFVKSSSRRTVGMIALALADARDDANRLEVEMRAAFEAMGFANVIRIGGSGKPDGTAEAHLAAAEDGTTQRYKVGLEAKSGATVSANRLNVAGIARHMKDYSCNHHLVIGNGFATSTGDDSASVREINTHRENTGLTITLMHIDDLVRLIRIASAKRIGGLSRLRDLFKTCVTPENSKGWVDRLAEEQPEKRPYTEILETIWHLAEEEPNEPVEYAAIVIELRHRTPSVRISKQDLVDCCKAMQVLASGVVFARENTVEIDRRPDLILEDIRAAVGEYPEEERRTIHI
jgi:hypothetical protein